MKVKIKEYFGELPNYLTLEKIYEVEEILDDQVLLINDDNGKNKVIFILDCAHLKYGTWEVVNE